MNQHRRGYREEVQKFAAQLGERRLPLGLGCAYIGSVGDTEMQKQYRATLEEAYTAGLRYYDTAELYGGSEFRVGQFLRTVDRNSVFVATKSRIPEQLTPEEAAIHVYQSLRNSLERLGVAQIDLFQLHAVDMLDQILPEGGVLERLVAARKEGLIRYIGLATRWHDLSETAAAHPEFDTILTYLDYNLIDQTAAQMIDFAAAQGIGVINGTPLANGLLVGTDPRTHTEMHTEVRRHRPLAIHLYDFCQERSLPLLALAIQYPLQNPDVSMTLFGPRNPQELHASLDAARTEIPADVWTELHRRFRLHLAESS
jgi:D-threo-aldose 1-dehydrogenase